MGTSKASEDGVAIHLLKLTLPVIAAHFLHVYSCSIVSGSVPEVWKTAIVTPMLKGGSQADLNNFRPFSNPCQEFAGKYWKYPMNGNKL